MLPTQDIIQNARSSGATLHSVAKALEMEPTELADALRLPADVVRQTTVSDEVQHRLHEVCSAFLATAELHEFPSDSHPCSGASHHASDGGGRRLGEGSAVSENHLGWTERIAGADPAPCP